MSHQDIVNHNKELVLSAMTEIEEKGLTKATVKAILVKLSVKGERRSESCVNSAMNALEAEGKIEKLGKLKTLGNPVEWGVVEIE
jgi:hypothetical protein